ncbi:hypothetical protein GGS21DRAFT_493902 [Xylaria nigripes]|nr:hypothetical protein GGS21DRAFT_493902 [Xylaria nigripes]
MDDDKIAPERKPDRLTTTREELAEEVAAETKRKLAEIRSLKEDRRFNTEARALNKFVSHPFAVLHPLRSTTTHRVIALPRTLGDLNAAPEIVIFELLRRLGQRPIACDRRAQLKSYIGLPP